MRPVGAGRLPKWGISHMRVMPLLAFTLSMSVLWLPAEAAACGAADPDDPMSWSEDFGVARCRTSAPRHHRDDYAGERARGYAESSDPMVWSDAQWRSTLFPGYARTYDDRYDRRYRREETSVVRRAARIEKRVEVTIVNDAEAPPADERPRGPKLLMARTASDMKTTTGVLRFGGHDCRGVLVLTWGTLGSKSRCHSGDGRIRTPD